ncbi:hypothetical protein [Pseudonocardia sp. N23]|uniref:hypothetical protein n=1 Tax=Pseudonocardia sp. N23 TaxID=1987376 RepID=UPI000BFC0629|nr:hypothetical protein [Pseudonocardia sp. N23]GAY10286.1 hypothetical protein TOK_4645 [Pseudonocardia sp. N23]
MANAKIVPILASRPLDDVVRFREALGFEVTYRQARPNIYAELRRRPVDLHFFGLDAHDPATSPGSVIVQIPGAVRRRRRRPARPRREAPDDRHPAHHPAPPQAGKGRRVHDRRPRRDWVRVASGRDDDEVAPPAGDWRAYWRTPPARSTPTATRPGRSPCSAPDWRATPTSPWPDRLPVLLHLTELLTRTADLIAEPDVSAAGRAVHSTHVGVDARGPSRRGTVARSGPLPMRHAPR